MVIPYYILLFKEIYTEKCKNQGAWSSTWNITWDSSETQLVIQTLRTLMGHTWHHSIQKQQDGNWNLSEKGGGVGQELLFAKVLAAVWHRKGSETWFKSEGCKNWSSLKVSDFTGPDISNNNSINCASRVPSTYSQHIQGSWSIFFYLVLIRCTN